MLLGYNTHNKYLNSKVGIYAGRSKKISKSAW